MSSTESVESMIDATGAIDLKDGNHQPVQEETNNIVTAQRANDTLAVP